MPTKKPILFFGAGAGRCGSMMLANLLNAEANILTLHEGKIREREESMQQWLPFLTLENYQAYASPEKAEEIFRDRRKNVYSICEQESIHGFGDVAYNNSPFVGVIPKVFPSAKLIVLVRDGRDFVRSVYTSDRPDLTPVGWLDKDIELSDLERYIAIGRIRPLSGSEVFVKWKDMTPVEKNAWLWNETYSVIMQGINDVWNENQVMIVKAENMFSDSVGVYNDIREFLGINWPKTRKVEDLLVTRINARSGKTSYILNKPPEWDETVKAQFWTYAKPMMDQFDYAK